MFNNNNSNNNIQDDNLKIVHEADNETEETITHMNNHSIIPAHKDNNSDNDLSKHRTDNNNRYPQAKYSFINPNTYGDSINEQPIVGNEMLNPVTKKYSSPNKYQQPILKQNNAPDWRELNQNEREKQQKYNNNENINNDNDDIQQELRKTQSSLQRLKKQQEFMSNNKFHSQKVNDTLQYQSYRDKFVDNKMDLRHNLHTPEERVVRTPNNYKKVRKNFYDTSKPFYNHKNQGERSIDEAIVNNLEERTMIDRIQRDIDREKSDFLDKYQQNHEQQNNSKYNRDRSIDSDKDKKNNNNNSQINSQDKINPDQLQNGADHYPHYERNSPRRADPEDDDEVDKYNNLIYPESFKNTSNKMAETASPRQLTLASYKDIYLDRQNKELFQPRVIPKNISLEEELDVMKSIRKNKKNQETEEDQLLPQVKKNNEEYHRKDILLRSKLEGTADEIKYKKNTELTYNFRTNETQMNMHYNTNNQFPKQDLDEKDLIQKLSQTFNVQQSIKDYKQQKEALKSTIKKRLTPPTDDDNFSLRDKSDFQSETPRATPKHFLSKTGSVRNTPNEYNSFKSNSGFDKNQNIDNNELDLDKLPVQQPQRMNSVKNPSNSFIAEIPLSTRNSQRRDFNGNPLNNDDFLTRVPNSARNSQPNQRYSSQPRPQQKIQTKQMDNFMNPRNSLEKANSKNLDESGIHLRTRVETQQGGIYPRNLLSQSLKKPPHVSNLDMSGLGNSSYQDGPMEMQSARIPRKTNDLRTQSVHMTPRESTKDKIFKQIDANPNELSQKKDLNRHFLEPQVDDFVLIDRKYNNNNNNRSVNMNNSRIDSELSQKTIIQKPILYPSRRLPSLNKGKNDFNNSQISKCCHDKGSRNSDLYPSKKYSYGQNFNCTKSVKNSGGACLKCPVCTSQLKVERLGQY